ncbi:MAG: MaoC/PaaZ C-terminal domain-containing protein [Marinobacter sp.]|uniref:MaoC/PaaZ C-terminal domain-containing protein n=1 Tax=Marinobacter sp. AC-23 TaxID=1879031 RepID=UPI0009F62E23|nr:MaoC/PaaZ C-terminal domain-containing protein [Marinobacter sp. AC-23]
MKSGHPAHTTCGEDLSPGDRIELCSYTISTDDIVKFACQWDPLFFHVDEERATTEGYFGGLIASGVQTLAIYQRLTVDSFVQHWDVIGGAGISDLQFRKPVRPGDILTGSTVVKNIELQPDRGRARVDCFGELINQHAEPVLVLTMSAYVRMRST